MARRIDARDGHRCVYCGAPAGPGVGHLDHVVARELGGADTPANLVSACASCNSAKGAMTLREWARYATTVLGLAAAPRTIVARTERALARELPELPRRRAA